MTEFDNLQWIQDTLNREIRQLVFQVARDHKIPNFNYQRYLEPITVKLTEEHRAVRKLPKPHLRCQARINKNGVAEQCSHRCSQGIFCLTHAKAPVKYGLISEPIPTNCVHLFRGAYPNTETVPTTKLVTKPTLPDRFCDQYDLTLLPLRAEYLQPLVIHSLRGGNQTVLQDPVTKYLYTNDPDGPKYIGQIADGTITR